MKTELNKKILRIAVVEILLQTGFEKCTEESLNVLSEVFSYYIEQVIAEILIPQTEVDESPGPKKLKKEETFCPAKLLLTRFYHNSQYNYQEMLQFLNQQIGIVRMLRDTPKTKTNHTEPNNMLSILKFLPKNQSLKNLSKAARRIEVEEKKESEEEDEAEMDTFLDNFLNDFIEKCVIKYQNHPEKVPVEYEYDLGQAICENNENGETENGVGFEQIETVMNTTENEEQQTFFNEFGRPKKRMIKRVNKEKHPLGG
ncbi:Y551 [Enterospora canceri]|uniref:Y551 n=1 Tax=Enterospora canceri TaxID=1081671 RepID=A0A1Y1S8S6_9MICR|nr:Y551 [Enterospora canceri]